MSLYLVLGSICFVLKFISAFYNTTFYFFYYYLLPTIQTIPLFLPLTPYSFSHSSLLTPHSYSKSLQFHFPMTVPFLSKIKPGLARIIVLRVVGSVFQKGKVTSVLSLKRCTSTSDEPVRA